MTPCQKKLLGGIISLAEEERLDIKIITVQTDSITSKEVSDFLRLIDKAHKATGYSKLKFDSYAEPRSYSDNASDQKEIHAWVRRLSYDSKKQ